jgi:glyoxylase-like metal-dependent hydrolase (beta-lactamase superfamily II)
MNIMALSKLVSGLIIALSLATAGAFAVPSPVHAAAPMQHKQVPGYYRTMVGDFEVTALYDGGAGLDSALLHGDKSQIEALLARSLNDSSKSVIGSVAGYVVNTGSQLILIDAGTGGHWGGPPLGKLVGNLKAAGYRSEQVDQILITHLHADHVGGIYNAKGRATFPHARIRVAKDDSDFWLSKDIAAKAPESVQIFFKIARDAAAPYIASGKWQPFDVEAELAPGIRPVVISGHTPGHRGYEVTSKGETLLIWGDVVHMQAVQMPHPEIGIDFDIDGPEAIKSRAELFAKLAEKKTLVGGAHMPFPSLGRLRKEDTGYSWIPATFVNLP